MNKKIMAILLSVFMGTVMLTGCGKGGAYPSDDIEVIVPKGAGGGTDTSTRGLLTYMEKNFEGAKFNVTNNPDGGGITGMVQTAEADADGYTLGAVTVGEPTGQFTSFFHMQSSLDKPVVLPNSQISVMLSNSWRDGDPLVEVQYDENGKLYPWESMILPDVYVYQDIEDIRQGLDSVIEWVLAQ